MTTANTTAYALSLEHRLDLIDDSICDLFMEAGDYARPDKRDALKGHLSGIVTELRAWRELAS